LTRPKNLAVNKRSTPLHVSARYRCVVPVDVVTLDSLATVRSSH
jgi:hypothetical protein